VEGAEAVRRSGLPWLALTLALAACADRPPQPAEDAAARPTRVLLRETTVLPLLEDEQPLVRVLVEGVGEATWLLDTGAEFSWIDAGFAERAGLRREPLGATLVGIHGEAEIAERALVPRVEVGGMVVTDFKPPLIPSMRPDVEGSLGQDLLRMTVVVLDGPGRRLILVPCDLWEEEAQRLLAPGNVALTYTVDWSRGVPVVHVPVAGLDGEHAFDVDTGSGPMTVTRELAEGLGLEQVGTRVGADLSYSRPTVPVYAIRDLALQDLTVSDDALEAPASRLGWGVLRNTVLVFEPASDALLLILEPKWRAPAEER